ncbi:hypothetical protein ABIA35_001116 [Catenulispora sp. MAP12-49]|uniref:hypothetical protein n=1 Tax=Catenulispora sp. MAP12-49 TaxID=3156302 RepID=UPI0035134C15
MTATVRGRHVVLPMPNDGIALPLGVEGDLRGWAESVAHSRMDGQAYPEEIASFAEALVEATADSAERGATLAIMFAPYPRTGESGRIEVRDYVPSQGMPQIPALTEVVQWFASPIGGATDPPEVVYGELPIGPAARLRFQILADPKDKDDVDAGILKNSVFIVRPRDFDCLVVMNVTWAAGVFTDELDQLADQLAQRMQIQ